MQGPLVPNSDSVGSAPIKNHLGNVAIIRDDDAHRINGGEDFIFVFGYVTYRDEFSFLLGARTIGYCARLNLHGGGSDGTFEGCTNAAYVYLR
jgi:hypothetical protein